MQPTDRGLLHVVPSNPLLSAADEQRAPIEGLMLSLGKLGVRVVALAAPRGDQTVRPLARALCASFAASDIKTAMIDLDTPAAADESDAGWNPGAKLGPTHTQREPDGYDLVVSRPNAQTRPLFNNLQHLKRALTEDLSGYKAVVILLAPVLNPGAAAPNPIAVARAADGVVVVCGTGRTNAADATHAVSKLTEAGCKVIGTVLDDSEGKNPGVEIADAVERMDMLPDWLKTRLGDTLRKSSLLNS